MYKLAKVLSTAMGLTPQKVPLTPEQYAQVMNDFIPALDVQYGEILVGGSTALKIYTGRDFNTHDTDYFLKSKEHFITTRGKYNEATLEADLETLSTHVLPGHNWSIKLSSMHEHSVVANVGTQEVEEFDTAIGGTINTVVDNNKVQFVMVDNSKDLEQWFMSASDLPVCINMNHGKPYFYVRNYWAGLMAKYGYLYSIRHRERRDKYEEKGFTCLNAYAI